MSECSSILNNTSTDGKLAFTASNAMNYIFSCKNSPDSWVANNYALFNINTQVCTTGYDEECDLPDGANNPTCPHQLGAGGPLTTQPVYNIQYPDPGASIVGGSLALATA